MPHPRPRLLAAHDEPLTSAVADRERAARPITLAPGAHRDGSIDVLAWAPGAPEAVVSVLPSLRATAADDGMVTFARAVPLGWVERAPMGRRCR